LLCQQNGGTESKSYTTLGFINLPHKTKTKAIARFLLKTNLNYDNMTTPTFLAGGSGATSGTKDRTPKCL